MTLTVGRRTTTVPAIATNQPTGGELDLTYWADDMTVTQTLADPAIPTFQSKEILPTT